MEKPIRFLHFYDISKEGIKTVEVHLDYEFFSACNWDIDLSKLLKIKSQTAKALFGVLKTNSNIRKDSTLIERTGIMCKRPDVARKMLAQAFADLEKNELTPRYARIKKGRGEYDYIPIVSSAPGEYLAPYEVENAETKWVKKYCYQAIDELKVTLLYLLSSYRG